MKRSPLISILFSVIGLLSASSAGVAQNTGVVQAPSAATLRAHTPNNITLWEVSLTGTAKECQLVIQKQKKSDTRKPSASECAQIFEWVTPAETAFQKHSKHKPGQLVDEPDYELTVGTKKGPVPFDAPKVCDLREDGSMSCTVNDLSAAQSLMLRLRAYGQDKHS